MEVQKVEHGGGLQFSLVQDKAPSEMSKPVLQASIWELASLKMIFCTKWRNMTVSSFILLFLTGTPSPISIISEDTFLSNKHSNNTCSFALCSYREETQVFHYENLWNNSLVYDFSFHIQHASSHLASNSTLLDLSLMMCTLSKTIF